MSEPTFECRSCGAGRGVVRYEFKGVDKVIRECSACKLMVLGPLPTEDELRVVYNDGYFDNAALTETDITKVYGYVDYISERVHKQTGYAGICRRLTRLAVAAQRPPRLLDYGCGLGFFLDSAFESGFEVQGVEFNQYAVDYIRKRYAHTVVHSAEFTGEDTYDVVTMFDVIEHLREPFETLEKVRGMLAKNGVLVVSTIDATSVTSRMMGKRLEDFRRIREHLFFFSRTNLAAVLRRCGFDVIETSSLGHSFELRLLAMRLRSVLPLVGTPMVWILRLLPFVGSWSIHLDPRTKFIAYARKREALGVDGLASRTVSIVIPVGDDAALVEPLLEELLAADLGVRKEIILASHGPGEAAEIVAERARSRGDVRHVRTGPGGEGAAVAGGLRASGGDYVVLQTADDGYDPRGIGQLLNTMARTGALAVYGSRYAGPYRRTGPFLRTLASRAFTMLVNLVNNLNLSDSMVGCKIFDGDLARAIDISSPGIEFEVELTSRLRHKGVSIYETPVSYEATRMGGRRVGAMDAWRSLAALVRFGLVGR